jgi:hypothetical protein
LAAIGLLLGEKIIRLTGLSSTVGIGRDHSHSYHDGRTEKKTTLFGGWCCSMLLPRLSLLLLALVITAAAAATSCDADQVTSQIVPLDAQVTHQYRYGGVADALNYYRQQCAQNASLAFAPSIPSCLYMNDDVCSAALGGDIMSIIRLLDALRTWKSPLISGTNGCIDPFTMPVADEQLNMISCPCIPGKECIDFTASAGGVVTMASMDDNTVLFTVVMWLGLAVIVIFALVPLLVGAWIIGKVEKAVMKATAMAAKATRPFSKPLVSTPTKSPHQGLPHSKKKRGAPGTVITVV